MVEPGNIDDPPFDEIRIPQQPGQLAQLNSVFVAPSGSPDTQSSASRPPDAEPFWHSLSEWENPVWAWVVINYVDSSLQFFHQDGTFHREVRHRAGKPSAWLPSPSPNDPADMQDPMIRQLKRLIDELSNEQYLREFIGTISRASASALSPSGPYSEFINSTMGRCLALVNAGWSLELARGGFHHQFESDRRPETGLLPEPSGNAAPSVRVRFGVTRSTDGLIGYFNSRSAPAAGDALELHPFYTPFVPENETSEHVTLSGYHKLHAYIPPESLSPERYDRQRNARLVVFGLLLDPIYPVRTYSDVLPTKELVLPSWTWQAAKGKMLAFFRAGPIGMTENVPEF